MERHTHRKTEMNIARLSAILLGLILPTAIQSQPLTDSAWSSSVKTIQLDRDGIPLESPTLILGKEDHLVLSFDILGEQPEALRYRIVHCDASWHRDDLEPFEYYSGFEENAIDNYESSFTTLQPYIHYSQAFPTNFDHFLASGNYVVYVYRQDEPDSILLTRRFCVSENILSVDMTVTRPTNGSRIDQDQEVTVSLFSDNSMLSRPEYLSVYVQQNGRTDNIRRLPFANYSNGWLCYRWKDENIFPGGNTFRYFDISNIHTPMYNVQKIDRYGGEFFALLRPEEERGNKPFSSGQSLNGGMKVNVWDRNPEDVTTQADYVWVNFSLPMKHPLLGGSIHIVGELTQWHLDDNSRMNWAPQLNAYTKRLYLKQGYYAYQLLFLPAGEDVGETALLEGDHTQTANQYHLYVYLRLPSDRYDRLIATR